MTSVAPCSDGGTILAGNHANNTHDSLLIVKTNASGQVQWSRYFTSADTDFNDMPFITENPLGGYYVLSGGYDQGLMQFTSRLTGIDVNGNVNWSKKYLTGYAGPYLQPSLTVEPNGNLLISLSLVDRLSIISTDPLGNIISNCSITADTAEFKDPGFTVNRCSDGGLLASGKANMDVFLVKLSSTGQIQWSKRYLNNNYSRAYSIVRSSDGANLVSGMDMDFITGYSKGFMMKIDNSGNILWYKNYDTGVNSSMDFEKMFLLSNGLLALSGTDLNTAMPIVLIMDQNGNVISSKQIVFPSIYFEWVTLSSTTSDDLLLTGYGYDFSFGSITTLFYRSSGSSMLWCGANDYPITVTNVSYNPTVISNVYYQFLSPIVTINSSVNSIPASILTTNYCTNSGINDLANENGVNLYPNPANSSATIDLDASSIDNNTNFILMDVLGKEVMKEQITNPKTQISRGDLPSGIYLYKITSVNGIVGSGKLIFTD